MDIAVEIFQHLDWNSIMNYCLAQPKLGESDSLWRKYFQKDLAEVALDLIKERHYSKARDLARLNPTFRSLFADQCLWEQTEDLHKIITSSVANLKIISGLVSFINDITFWIVSIVQMNPERFNLDVSSLKKELYQRSNNQDEIREMIKVLAHHLITRQRREIQEMVEDLPVFREYATNPDFWKILVEFGIPDFDEEITDYHTFFFSEMHWDRDLLKTNREIFRQWLTREAQQHPKRPMAYFLYNPSVPMGQQKYPKVYLCTSLPAFLLKIEQIWNQPMKSLFPYSSFRISGRSPEIRIRELCSLGFRKCLNSYQESGIRGHMIGIYTIEDHDM